MTKSIKKDLNKVNKLLHPRSRKAQKLHQKANRLITREKSKKFHAMKENLIGEKLQWFKDRLIPNVRRYTGQMCLDIISTYLSRFDQELEQITIVHTIGKNRKNRRFASREDVINMTILHEKEEFETCGLEIPDLMNMQQLAYLRSWNGELRFLQNFHLTRYTRKQLEEKNDTLLPEDYLPQDDKEEEDVAMEEDESHGNDSREDEQNEDSEWSDVPDESDEDKDPSKPNTTKRNKMAHAFKKHKRCKGKMMVE
ncbi:hypothetical protein R5R35_014814 [Gryllus longicercus]|uniref:Translation machinery-associated protein 16 n=1 Tax=Gryllus longicercus TaxID=2509291 RepID=A0AAN9VM79_9ORTH